MKFFNKHTGSQIVGFDLQFFTHLTESFKRLIINGILPTNYHKRVTILFGTYKCLTDNAIVKIKFLTCNTKQREEN